MLNSMDSVCSDPDITPEALMKHAMIQGYQAMFQQASVTGYKAMMGMAMGNQVAVQAAASQQLACG